MGGIRNFFLLIRKFWENVLRVTKLKDRVKGITMEVVSVQMKISPRAMIKG